MTSRKPTAGFWITAALVAMLVAYPLSFGPVCWILCRALPPSRCFARAYWPLILAASSGPESIQRTLTWYAELSAPPVEFESVVFSAGVSSRTTVKIKPLDMLRAAGR